MPITIKLKWCQIQICCYGVGFLKYPSKVVLMIACHQTKEVFFKESKRDWGAHHKGFSRSIASNLRATPIELKNIKEKRERPVKWKNNCPWRDFTNQKSIPLEVFYKIAVLKNLRKYLWKHLCKCVFFTNKKYSSKVFFLENFPNISQAPQGNCFLKAPKGAASKTFWEICSDGFLFYRLAI